MVMIPNLFGGPPDKGEPNYFLWTMVGLFAAVAGVLLVLLYLG